MQVSGGQSVEIRKALVAHERPAAIAVVEAANAAEGLDLPLGFGEDFEPTAPDADLSRQYTAYAGDVLAGLANIQTWDEPEVLIVVHPGYRRHGIGRALLAVVGEDYRRHGASQLLLVTDERSTAGKAFIAAVGAEFRLAEYALVLDTATVDRSRPRLEALALRAAAQEDEDLLIRLTAVAFGDPEDATRAFLPPLLRASNRRFWVITLADEPIGGIGIVWNESSAGITTFGVVPEHRGRGYGRQILLEVIDILLAEGYQEITIDVATENRNALGLYRACGFQETTTFGYYELTL
ncbi:MAG TPA: GNAT family N-acetyltransferase [Herpetosiphonaceae bacterium]|nr:GNAT family N-acetyltransferase [Herpetosiphonaceae bacterium]